MSNYQLIENEPSWLELTKSEISVLRLMDEEMAKNSKRDQDYELDDDNKGIRIHIEEAQGYDLEHQGKTKVIVKNAVGNIKIGEKPFKVIPKIGFDHFLKIYSFNENPEKDWITAKDQTKSSKGDVWELLIRSFLNETEKIISKGLKKGYKEVREEIKYVKGNINLLQTTRNLMRGNILIDTNFEEFTDDININRILKAAALRISQVESYETSGQFEEFFKQKSKKIILNLSNVDELQPLDTYYTIDRNNKYYEKALEAAVRILNSTGVSINTGEIEGSCFLMNTPPLIENGMRIILNRNLPEHIRCNLRGSVKYKKSKIKNISINPDLIFGQNNPIGVGDIKYKLHEYGKISQADRYQQIYFAHSYDVSQAVLIGFSKNYSNNSYDVFGEDFPITLHEVNWNCSDNMSSEKALDKFVKDLIEVLTKTS